MAIYVISDLHLSYGVDKPMFVFGEKWKGYEEKIKKDWMAKVKTDDWVILAGDFSWAMYLDEAIKDFQYLNELPGKKILLKGNHDYWWETVKKMNTFLEKNNIKDVYFLHNNCIEADQYIICGTRYWSRDENEDNEKIFKRETERAKISLNKARLLNEQLEHKKDIIMVTHYPPDDRLVEELKGYNIKYWIYAHIHSNYEKSLVNISGIETMLTSCDYLNFKLKRLGKIEKL